MIKHHGKTDWLFKLLSNNNGNAKRLEPIDRFDLNEMEFEITKLDRKSNSKLDAKSKLERKMAYRNQRIDFLSNFEFSI